MRDLKPSDSINLNECREFNHLRISNLDVFKEYYQPNCDYYLTQFGVLWELQKKIMFQNNPLKTILVPYKPGGDIIFGLVEIKEEGELRIVVYEYQSSVS
jgi:hypothetical protein